MGKYTTFSQKTQTKSRQAIIRKKKIKVHLMYYMVMHQD